MEAHIVVVAFVRTDGPYAADSTAWVRQLITAGRTELKLPASTARWPLTEPDEPSSGPRLIGSAASPDGDTKAVARRGAGGVVSLSLQIRAWPLHDGARHGERAHPEESAWQQAYARWHRVRGPDNESVLGNHVLFVTEDKDHTDADLHKKLPPHIGEGGHA